VLRSLGRKMKGLLSLLFVAAVACRGGGPVALAHTTEGANEADASPPVPERCKGPVLAAGDLEVEWQQGEVAMRLELAGRDRVVLNGKAIAHLAGSCVLDLQGRILRAVESSGAVLGPAGQRVGTLTARASVVVDGQPVPVGYVFTDSAHEGAAISDSGEPYVLTSKGPPFAAVGHVGGDVVHAKRTALVLWTLGPTLTGRE
jgi:hypothetical protein